MRSAASIGLSRLRRTSSFSFSNEDEYHTRPSHTKQDDANNALHKERSQCSLKDTADRTAKNVQRPLLHAHTTHASSNTVPSTSQRSYLINRTADLADWTLRPASPRRETRHIQSFARGTETAARISLEIEDENRENDFEEEESEGEEYVESLRSELDMLRKWA